MNDASDIGERQIATFQRYLEMMVNRRKRVDRGDSFIAFGDKQPDTTRPEVPSKSRARKLVLASETGTGGIDLSDRDILVAGDRSEDDADDRGGEP